MAPSLVTLTTDFGTLDPYVAEMKGVMLGLNPRLAIVDVSHDVPAQGVAPGAFVLGGAYPSFPSDTIHVAIVDPGVGSSRRAILLVTPRGLFLDPDNGLLTYAVRESPEYRNVETETGFHSRVDAAVPAGCAAYVMTDRGLWQETVSDTFHGRDLFAPVAAHLSLGTRPEHVGEAIDSIVCLNVPHPRVEGDTIRGHVVHIDRFGNLITTIDGGTLVHDRAEVRIRGHRIAGASRSYAQGPDLLAIVGSHGTLEIAVRNGSAARGLGAAVGDEVVVWRGRAD